MTKEISDLYLVSVLRLRGHYPAEVQRDGRGRAVWVFESGPAIEGDIAAYYSGNLTVPARRLCEEVRSTKGEALHGAAATPARVS